MLLLLSFSLPSWKWMTCKKRCHFYIIVILFPNYHPTTNIIIHSVKITVKNFAIVAIITATLIIIYINSNCYHHGYYCCCYYHYFYHCYKYSALSFSFNNGLKTFCEGLADEKESKVGIQAFIHTDITAIR